MERLVYLSENKHFKILMVALSAYFIYKLGKSCGEFFYYFTH
ncbi:hypothetical protein CLV57_2034 [Mucilaginibacter auburnensis]|uniref:Uncharacterized protein n=1 Tax=Mucilaginibacter auburnensis TaxID=1457233 RepID=A0A2H9VW20_9SPHI|nr:hypothetical protein CLV57_2034 [Mucilaginibacter auburnensis]